MLTKAQRVQLMKEIEKEMEDHKDLLSSLRRQINSDETRQAVETPDDAATTHEGLISVSRTITRVTECLKKLTRRWNDLKNGFDGLCDDCGGDIPFDRLLAQPTTHHCITCKSKGEKEDRRDFGHAPGHRAFMPMQ
ncbi:MAG: TraR/DksA C4-type zinc finger protein [Patescibacteria group bacterium]|nr:TraR/DksA C4-type zinc finger protein [Patescibacteria group bacterium]